MPHFNPALKFTLLAVCGLYLLAAQAAMFVEGRRHSRWDTLTILTTSEKQHKIRWAEIGATHAFMTDPDGGALQICLTLLSLFLVHLTSTFILMDIQ